MNKINELKNNMNELMSAAEELCEKIESNDNLYSEYGSLLRKVRSAICNHNPYFDDLREDLKAPEDRKIEIPCNSLFVYRHFKGKWYAVKNVALSSEDKKTKFVIYQALYGNNQLYVRPYDEFLSKVDKEKYPNANQEYRFMSLDELKKSLGEEKAVKLMNEEMYS